MSYVPPHMRKAQSKTNQISSFNRVQSSNRQVVDEPRMIPNRAPAKTPIPSSRTLQDTLVSSTYQPPVWSARTQKMTPTSPPEKPAPKAPSVWSGVVVKMEQKKAVEAIEAKTLADKAHREEEIKKKESRLNNAFIPTHQKRLDQVVVDDLPSEFDDQYQQALSTPSYFDRYEGKHDDQDDEDDF